MSDRGDLLRLADMHDQIDFKGRAIRDKSEADFLSDRELYQAVAFSLQVIGEAAKTSAQNRVRRQPMFLGRR